MAARTITRPSRASSSCPTRRRRTGPDLAAEWDGRQMSSHAGEIRYAHSDREVGLVHRRTRTSATGSAPTTGSCRRSATGELRRGWAHVPPDGVPLAGSGRFLQARLLGRHETTASSSARSRPASGWTARLNSFARVRLAFDKVAAAGRTCSRNQLVYTIQISPSGVVLAASSLDGFLGERGRLRQLARRAGARTSRSPRRSGRPTTSRCQLNGALSWLDVTPDAGGERQRLFTAEVARLKATYTFTSRALRARDRAIRPHDARPVALPLRRRRERKAR